MADKATCAGVTKAGKPCKASPQHGSPYCAAHADQVVLAMADFRKAERSALRDPREDNPNFVYYRGLLEKGMKGKLFEVKAKGGTGESKKKVSPQFRVACGERLGMLEGWIEPPTAVKEAKPAKVFYTPDDGRG